MPIATVTAAAPAFEPAPAHYVDHRGNQVHVAPEYLGTGSYAKVYPVIDDPLQAAKIYRSLQNHWPRRQRLLQTEKLAAMISMQPPRMPEGIHVAWPTATIHAADSTQPEIANGYLMARAPAGSRHISEFARPYDRSAKSLAAAKLIPLAVSALHDQNIIIGDINGRNFALSPDDQLWLFDADGWQLTTPEGRLHYAQGATDHYTHHSVFDAISGARPNCTDPMCPQAGLPHHPTPSCRPRQHHHDDHGVNVIVRDLTGRR